MKHLKLNEFIIKIFAIIFMTLDHIGLFLINFSNSAFTDSSYVCGYIFRCFGRLALPLFILMLVEGIRHSKNVWLYLLRIGIVMTVIMVSEIIIYYLISSDIEIAYSPFVDLFLCALTLILLKRKDKFSFFAILPIVFIVFTFIIQLYESINNVTFNYLPFYIRPGYSLLGLLLSLLFYYSYSFVEMSAKKKGIEIEEFKKLPSYQFLVNITQISCLIIVNILIFIMSNFKFSRTNWFNNEMQTWSIFASLLIFFYNGKRGYNKKWFQYFSYIYFPVHIVIIYFVFYLIYLV